MFGFRPFGSAPKGIPDESSSLSANAAFGITHNATLSSGLAVAASAALALTVPSASLVTAITPAASANLSIATSASLGALQALAASANFGVLVSVSLDPRTFIYGQDAGLSIATTAGLTTNEQLRGASQIRAFVNDNTDYAILSTRIPLNAAPSILESVNRAELVTAIQLRKVLGDALLVTQASADLLVQKFFDGAANLSFAAAASLTARPLLQATSSDVHIISIAQLDTTIPLVAAVDIGTIDEAELASGIQLRKIDGDRLLTTQASAYLTTPAPGTVTPWSAQHMKADITYRLGGIDYSGFTFST